MRTLFRVWLVVLFTTVAACAWAQDKACAVVVMHGKWGTPRSLNHFGNQLDPVCDFKAIEMPWSKRRNYDAPYPAALAQIKEQVATFRQQGFKRVVLAGHSFGANAALAYMSTEADVDAVVILAAGHSPASMYQRGMGREAVDKAHALVTEGKGDESLTMEDLNQGARQSIHMRADVLWSYFDPQGLGNMALTAANFKKAVPVLWVVGTRDPLYPQGTAYAFDKTPHHDASKYLVLETDHGNTPEVAVTAVKEWLKALP